MLDSEEERVLALREVQTNSKTDHESFQLITTSDNLTLYVDKF